jgi:undecaprenyl-diphosphatase
MTVHQATVLGIVQGLGEFLPISSSGHLIVVPWMLGWPDSGLAFDVALHLGTAFAVVYAFLGEWWALARGTLAGLREKRLFETAEGRLLSQIVVASIPAGIAGLLLERWAETTFRSPALVGATMAVLGIILWVADARARPAEGPAPAIPAVSWTHAILIGLAQCLALVPGVSRSGSTISAGLLLGVERPEAARFSFLLATPITVAAVLRKVPALVQGGDEPAVLLIGIAVAAAFGLLSIRVLLAYVRTRNYRPFVYYRMAFAALTFLLLWLRSQ